jgi:hypothetical protein
MTCIMPDYRAYIIGPDGHFYDSVDLDCADDDEALKRAGELVSEYGVELWQRPRKIARFGKKEPKIQ